MASPAGVLHIRAQARWCMTHSLPFPQKKKSIRRILKPLYKVRPASRHWSLKAETSRNFQCPAVPDLLTHGNACHTISVQLVSTLASRRKCLPNCSCPDYLVISHLSRHPLLLNSKEAPTCKRQGRCEVAFLASRHTVQHPRQEIR